MTKNWLPLATLLLLLPLAGLWFWPGLENRTQMLGGLALASLAVGGVLLRLRLRAGRRWRAALDAYAERALARHRRQRRPKAPAVSGVPRGVPLPAR